MYFTNTGTAINPIGIILILEIYVGHCPPDPGFGGQCPLHYLKFFMNDLGFLYQ